MTSIPSSLPGSSLSSSMIVLIVLMWVAWVLVLAVAGFFAFMMLAFADSPGSAGAVKLMIIPMFVWCVLAVVVGAALLISRGYWQVPLAFVLAISPPFMMFLGFNLFSSSGRSTPVVIPANVQPATTPGRFAPPKVVAPTMNFPQTHASRFEIDPEIANRILDLAQDWGEDFMQPTQPRSASLYPNLSDAERAEYDRLARDVIRTAHDVLYRNPDAGEWAMARAVRKEHAWVSDENMGRLFTQGKWFANK